MAQDAAALEAFDFRGANDGALVVHVEAPPTKVVELGVVHDLPHSCPAPLTVKLLPAHRGQRTLQGGQHVFRRRS